MSPHIYGHVNALIRGSSQPGVREWYLLVPWRIFFLASCTSALSLSRERIFTLYIVAIIRMISWRLGSH